MKKQKNENVSYLSEVLDKLKEHKMAMAGLVVLILEILMVVFLPIILNLDPYTSDYTAFSAAPSGAHILGTDAIGRDVFARLMYGGRTSLLVGFVSTLISCAIGVHLGLVAGYARGKAEAVIMRIADIFMSFPSIVLILVLVAVLGPSVWSVTCVIGVLGWTQFARLIYANVLSVSEKEYVESARAIGTSNFKIVTKYVLPNSFAPILIAITFQGCAHLPELQKRQCNLKYKDPVSGSWEEKPPSGFPRSGPPDLPGYYGNHGYDSGSGSYCEYSH